MRSWLPLLAWLGSLAAGIVLFSALGGGVLEAPPLGQPSAWADWAAARDPFVAAVAVLRLVALALAWYLVAVTTVGLVARLTRAARLVRMADALSVNVVRQMLQGALGLTLAAGVVASSPGAVPASAGAVPAAAARADDAAPVTAAVDITGRGEVRMAALGADGGAATVTLGVAGRDGVRMVALDDEVATGSEGDGAGMVALDGPSTARMVGLGPPGAGGGATDHGEAALDEHEISTDEDEHEVGDDGSDPEVATDGSEHEVVDDGSDPEVATDGSEHEVVDDGSDPELADDGSEHEVVAGEHLWAIAADRLAAHLDRSPTEVEIAPYWRRLVDDNRDRLANPDDPDLIFPGQRLVLPDLPGGPGA